VVTFFLLSLHADEETAVRRVYSHLFVQDPRSAVKEAEEFLKVYPQSHDLSLAYLQALTEKGDATAALQVWEKSQEAFVKNRHALEILAWGVLSHGGFSSQVNIHLTSLVGAALTHDVRALPLLVQGMRSSQAVMRLIAVRFAAMYGDGPLQEEIRRLVVEEKVWFVRQEAIRAVGALRMKSMRGVLKEIIADRKTLAEEKAAAIIALVQIYDNVRKDDLRKLLSSDRAGLRQLGCELVSYFNLHEYAEELVPLLNDTSPDVRGHALQTLGLLKVALPGLPGAKLQTLMNDSFPAVAISAGWIAALQGDHEGVNVLTTWLKSPHLQWRLEAAAALTRCGKLGLNAAISALQEHNDPLVKMNLALGLIGQRVEVEKAAAVLYEMFDKEPEKLLMWDESSQFRMLVPSELRHHDQIPNYPKVIDQMVRLELLNVLAILRHPKAQEAVKVFLKNEAWGVTGVAVAVLVEEGDEEALEMARGLLKDEDREVRVQAAFILAMMGSDPAAVKVLQEAYPQMPREMKVQILEAIGHVGDQESIPFLIEVLKEPFQLLRVVAASSMIRCLYH
jgi:HEAT repeat protein